jgi:ferredoxin-nitrite reductase
VQLAGISGHKKLACDAGILIPADRVTTVALAMVKVFSEHGCRTDRKKARLKYLLDDWGTEKFLTEVQKKLPDFSLLRFPEAMCRPPSPALTHGHVGVYRQRQRGLNYLGVVVPVGRLTVRQMRRLAELARNYGSSELRLTPWQNLLIPNIPDAYVETVKRAVVGAGLGWQASSLSGGLVACTGNQGCKYASTNTKGHALQLAKYLEGKVNLDQPINIHFTGCPNSCAQHYIGDIGLIGTKATLSGESVEAYHVVLGGGVGVHKGIGQEVFRGIPFSQLPKLLEHVLEVFLQLRQTGESFAHFVRRHSLRELQELFS